MISSLYFCSCSNFSCTTFIIYKQKQGSYCFNVVSGKLNTKNYYLYVKKISKIQYQLCLTSFISLDYILSIVRLE